MSCSGACGQPFLPLPHWTCHRPLAAVAVVLVLVLAGLLRRTK